MIDDCEVSERMISRLKNYSEFSSILIIIIGILVLIGWAFNIAIFKSPGAGFSTIKSNAGLAFILLGVSLWLMQTKRVNYNNRRVAQILALIVALIGILTLIEYLSGVNLGIDQLFFKESAGALHTSSPNRMAFSAALDFVIAGLAIILMDIKFNYNNRPAQILAIIGGLISVFALVGYSYGASLFYDLPQYTAISVYAAFTFILIFFGLLAARPDTGFMQLITGNNLVGRLLRRLLPLIIATPIIIGLLGDLGYRNSFYGPYYGYALVWVTSIIVLILLLWFVIVPLNKSEILRKKAEIKLRTLMGNLEEQVKERTKELNYSNIALKSSNEELQVISEELQSSNEELQSTTEELHVSNEELQHQQKELRELVDKLEVSNRELEQFAYVASHDLQEPLRMVTSFTQLLEHKYRGQLDKDADEYIGFVIEGTHRMKDLIDDLLVFSRLNTQARKFELFDMQTALNGVLSYLKPYIEENHAQITYDSLPSIRGDSSQIKQLLQNLLSNAIKFHNHENPLIHISVEESRNEWTFGVSDNGIGIDPRHQEQIFKVFKRLHTREEYTGSGIGLSICKKIVERHGGHIWVESELEKGSTFYFTIPKTINEHF